MADVFGEIRGLLARGPSAQVFDEICLLLDRFGESGRQEEIDYLEAHLSRWPKEIKREAPKRWRWRVFMGEDVPELALANAFTIGEPTPPDAVERLLASPFARNLRALCMEWILSNEAIDALHRSPHSRQITELQLFAGQHDEEAYSRWFEEDGSQLLQGLHKLSMPVVADSNGLLEVLNRTNALASLRELTLSSTMLEHTSNEEEEGAAEARQTQLLEVFAKRWLGKLGHLGVSNAYLYDEQLEAIVSLGFFDTISSIDFSYNDLSGDLMRAILTRPERVPIRALALEGASLPERSGASAERLPEHLFAELEEFSLSCMGEVDGMRLELLERLPEARKLKKLRLTQGSPDDEHIIPVFEALPPTLEDLTLNSIKLSAPSYSVLLERSWPALRRLEFRSSDFTDQQMRALVSSDTPSLQELEITYNPITSAGIDALASSALLGGLKTLACYRNNNRSDSLGTLFSAPALTGLRNLHFINESFSIETITALVEMGRRSNLEEVVFYGCSFQAGALDVLSAARDLCERLQLVNCPLEEDVAIGLVQSPLIETLREFTLRDDATSAAVARALLEAAPPHLMHVEFEPKLLDEDLLRAYLESGWLWGRQRARFEGRLWLLTKKASR